MKCLQCGECCRTRSIDITMSDILRWDSEERWDILSEVYLIDNYPNKGMFGFFFEKSLKKKDNYKRYCPFLKDNKCLIHDTKPSGCADAPLAYEVFCECPVFKKQEPHVIKLYQTKQARDLAVARANKNIVMGILVKAREWLK
jgi:Fe-S-cluster containining protein